MEWRVGRVWVSRRIPRWRRVRIGGAASDAGWYTPWPDGDLEGVVLWLAILVGSLVVAVILIPLLLFGIELIALGLLVAVGILGRALLGRPWVVRASPLSGHDPALAWRVSGWRRSARLIEEVAASLAGGLPPAPAEASVSPPTNQKPASALDV